MTSTKDLEKLSYKIGEQIEEFLGEQGVVAKDIGDLTQQLTNLFQAELNRIIGEDEEVLVTEGATFENIDAKARNELRHDQRRRAKGEN